MLEYAPIYTRTTMFDKLSSLVPPRYRKLLSGRTSKIIVISILAYLFIDLTLGYLIITYLDPIKFSEEHPYIVLSSFFAIGFSIKYIFRKEKPKDPK
jgi:hypothetical protein